MTFVLCLIDMTIHMISIDDVWWSRWCWKRSKVRPAVFFHSYTTLMIVIVIFICSMGIIRILLIVSIIFGLELGFRLELAGLCFLLSLLLGNLDTSHGVPILCATSFRSTHFSGTNWGSIVSSGVCVCVCVCVCVRKQNRKNRRRWVVVGEVKCWLTDWLTDPPPPRGCLELSISLSQQECPSGLNKFLTFTSVLFVLFCVVEERREESEERRENSKQSREQGAIRVKYRLFHLERNSWLTRESSMILKHAITLVQTKTSILVAKAIKLVDLRS